MSVRNRHIILIVVAVIVAGTCIRLGFWQLHRLHGRRDVNTMLEARGAEPTVPIGSLALDALPYHHVTATGEYDPTHEQILSGRSQNENPGNHVLTPLVLGDGTAVIVDRGWVPLETTTPPVTGAAAAPAGWVTVTGLALPPDQVSDPAVVSPAIVTRIDLGRSDLPYRLLPVYVLLQSQTPTQASPEIVAPPGFDNGPHLSYAVQWFSFATIAVVGCVVLLVRDHRGNSDAPAVVG